MHEKIDHQCSDNISIRDVIVHNKNKEKKNFFIGIANFCSLKFIIASVSSSEIYLFPLSMNKMGWFVHI